MPYCANCGREISALAVSCPQCGHPNEARTTVPEVAFTASGPTAVGDYAGFWIRLLSLIIDGLILLVVEIPLLVAFVTSSSRYGASVFIYNPISLIPGFLYAWLMIAFVRGQTLGMMVCGIRITRPDGSPVDLGRSAARAGMAIISRLPFSLGYLWAAWDPEKRTWHDMVADTRVYKARR
jgi:uncharacterized RDD family membrane protein YckC